MVGNSVRKLYGNIPNELRLSLMKAALFFIAWHLVYHIVLEPTNFPDKQLIDLLLTGTTRVLSLFLDQVYILGDTIYINGRSVLTVYKQCDGLDFFIIYSGFLLSIYEWNKRLLKYTIVGIVAIYGMNILRCFFLSLLFYNNFYPHSFTHHQLFNLAMYAIMLVIWLYYARDIQTVITHIKRTEHF